MVRRRNNNERVIKKLNSKICKNREQVRDSNNNNMCGGYGHLQYILHYKYINVYK